MLHLATISRNFFTSTETLFVPVPDIPVLVNMSNADHISLLAKSFPPAVDEGSVTRATWSDEVFPVPLQSVHVENAASVAESLNCSTYGVLAK